MGHGVKRHEQIKKIPGFWAKACQQHPQLYCLIDEEDKKVFEYLTDIDVDMVNQDGVAKNRFGEVVNKTLNFTVTFKFNENPYFENAELVKRFYQFGEDVHSEGEEIKWKEGKNLLEKETANEANGDAATNGAEPVSFLTGLSTIVMLKTMIRRTRSKRTCT